MAATNFTPIQLYFSTTASAVPTAANLAQGELAINITDGKLYYEDNGGVVQVIATKGAGTIGGSTTQIQYNNAGALAGNAAMVFNNSTNVTTLTTLNLTNALGATYGGTAQSAYAQGDVLYASATNTLSKLGIGTVNYILTSTGSVPQWVAPTSVTVNTATNLAGGVAGSVPYQSGVATTTFLAIGAANRVMTSTGTAPQWVTSLTGLTGVSSSSITNTSLTSGRVVIASTAGLEADSANLTFDGTTLSSTGYSTTGLSTLVKTVKIGDSSFNGVAVFAAATPAKLYMGTGTVTDVTSAISATNAIGAIASLGITPIAATNTSVTYTNAATLYIAGAPSAGTNITITNPYSLYIAAGASYFGGAVDFAVTPSYSGGTANGVMYLNGSKQITTGAVLTFDGTTLSSTKFAGALNGTVGATTATTGAFTTVTASTAIGTASGGTGLGGATPFTANGVVYASSTSALATGSALTFDGSQLGIGTASGTSNGLKLNSGNAGANYVLYRASATGLLTIYGNQTGFNGLTVTGIDGDLATLTSTGLGIGTSSPAYKLDVNGTGNFYGVLTARSSIRVFGESSFGGDNPSPTTYAANFGLAGLSAANLYGAVNSTTYPATTTNSAHGFVSTLATANAAFTLPDLYNFRVWNVSKGAASTITNQYGLYVNALSGATNNYAIYTNTGTVYFGDNVGIGTSSPASTLDVRGTSPEIKLVATTGTNGVGYTVNNTGGNFYFGRDSSSGGYYGSGSAYSAVLWSVGAYPMVFATNNTEQARIPAAGGFQSVGSISVGNATPSTSGAGITFPATQSASTDANTLDDYEEGTWTSSLTVTAATSGTITVTDKGGTYTKIGNIVTVQGYFNVASVSSAVGELRVGGLPFSTNASVGYGSVALQPYGFGNTNSVTAYYGLQVSNQTYFAIRGLLNGAQVSNVSNNVQASTGMQFTMTYQV